MSSFMPASFQFQPGAASNACLSQQLQQQQQQQPFMFTKQNPNQGLQHIQQSPLFTPNNLSLLQSMKQQSPAMQSSSPPQPSQAFSFPQQQGQLQQIPAFFSGTQNLHQLMGCQQQQTANQTGQLVINAQQQTPQHLWNEFMSTGSTQLSLQQMQLNQQLQFLIASNMAASSHSTAGASVVNNNNSVTNQFINPLSFTPNIAFVDAQQLSSQQQQLQFMQQSQQQQIQQQQQHFDLQKSLQQQAVTPQLNQQQQLNLFNFPSIHSTIESNFPNMNKNQKSVVCAIPIKEEHILDRQSPCGVDFDQITAEEFDEPHVQNHQHPTHHQQQQQQTQKYQQCEEEERSRAATAPVFQTPGLSTQKKELDVFNVVQQVVIPTGVLGTASNSSSSSSPMFLVAQQQQQSPPPQENLNIAQMSLISLPISPVVIRCRSSAAAAATSAIVPISELYAKLTNTTNLTDDASSESQMNEMKRMLGISVRDKSTLAPFLMEWNSRDEVQQVLQKSYELLSNFSQHTSSTLETAFTVEYSEQQQKCNYVNKFINSKGLIVKDDKLGKIKIENKISRFHNLSRLLMYTILNAFHKHNLQLMNLDALRSEAILKMIQRLKQSARKKTPKGLIKTDFFNHTHYNVLFLTINESNLETVRKNAKDVSTHAKVYGIDLEKPYAEIVHDIRYSNVIKRLAYHIMLASYKRSKDDKQEQDSNPNSNSTYREQYIDRAMLGIAKLNQGILIQRKGANTDIQKCLVQGKPVIIEGTELNPKFFLRRKPSTTTTSDNQIPNSNTTSITEKATISPKLHQFIDGTLPETDHLNESSTHSDKDHIELFQPDAEQWEGEADKERMCAAREYYERFDQSQMVIVAFHLVINRKQHRFNISNSQKMQKIRDKAQREVVVDQLLERYQAIQKYLFASCDVSCTIPIDINCQQQTLDTLQRILLKRIENWYHSSQALRQQ